MGSGFVLEASLLKMTEMEGRISILYSYPNLKSMFKTDNGNTEVFYFKNATATFYSITKEPRTAEL